MKVVSRKNPRQEKLNKLRRRNIPPSGNHLPLTDNMGSTYQKILQEIAIMKRCRHPHIVRLLEVIDDKIYKKIYMSASLPFPSPFPPSRFARSPLHVNHISTASLLFVLPQRTLMTLYSRSAQLWSFWEVERSSGETRTGTHSYA